MRTDINDTTAFLSKAFAEFWDAQLRIAPEGQGLVLALPLMDASGWQVVVHLEPLTETQWRISDHGATLAMLHDAGKNPDSDKVAKVIDAQCRFYGFERDGLVLRRVLSFPFDPAEIQIFAEGLVALTHLSPKIRKQVIDNPLPRMEERIDRYFKHREVTPQRNHALSGQIEPVIKVDFYWERDAAEVHQSLALQPVGPQKGLHAYMEQWAWRWTDLRNAHPDLVRAMVFDPDNQQWNAASLKLGKEVCDVFVPYFEAEEALDQVFAA